MSVACSGSQNMQIGLIKCNLKRKGKNDETLICFKKSFKVLNVVGGLIKTYCCEIIFNISDYLRSFLLI